MANSTNKTTTLTSDIYGINAYIDNIKKKFTPNISEETLSLGIFGYTGQIFSDLIQNSIVMASEFSNESIPTKAKFEKNIIAHALSLGINDIYAVPAQMDVLLTFVEDDIEAWAKAVRKSEGKSWNGSWEFVFDKDTPIYIGDFEFHTDYDIMIRKVPLNINGEENSFAYTAKYIIDDNKNPISNITNPYLTSPVKMHVNNQNVIFTSCTIRQVEKTTVHKKILADNSISSKTMTFEFEGQLAAFDIDVTENGVTTHLNPIYEGLASDDDSSRHFFYSYLDSKVIRIKFDRDSYQPRINSEITINIQTTQGDDGNFTYTPDTYPAFAVESDKYGYSNIGCELRPITGESQYGVDSKSIDDLKKFIPKESLSRGSITNLVDLENFFNMLNNEDSKMYFYKKRDNALERLYYSFLLMRDSLNNIIPTNTIDIKLLKPNADSSNGSMLIAGDNNSKYIFRKDTKLKLEGNYAVVHDGSEIEDDKTNFYYTIPYNFVINASPLYGMYSLSIIDMKKFLDFDYINEACLYQYIATSIHWNRGYLESPNTYEMSISIEQNIDSQEDVSTADGESLPAIRCIAVFYDKDDNPYRWAEGSCVNADAIANIYSYKFYFDTDDKVDTENRIQITSGMYDLNSTTLQPGYFNANAKCIIHILTTQSSNASINDEVANKLNGLEKIVPGLDSYILTNSYIVREGVDFFYDYSEIVNSTVTVSKDQSGDEYFTIYGVPVVKHDYFDDEDKAITFANELIERKTYIDYAINVLEDAFGMNFKFFNTYGPSKLFTTDEADPTALVDRVNISLRFRLKLTSNYDTNIVNNIIEDIKTYIEDLEDINTLHIPNLITQINIKYSESIVYFEFLGINGYGPGTQHFFSQDMPVQLEVPEFITVHTLPTGKPDITVSLV